MLTFHQTKDPTAREIRRKNCLIGTLQWHDRRAPRVVMRINEEYDFEMLTLAEMEEILAKYKEIKEGKCEKNTR